MAEFKLCLGDVKSGKTVQIEVKEESAAAFLNKKIGDKVKGEVIDKPGYEFEITGGADYCGFPMRKDLDGPIRKRIMITQGVGIRNTNHGIRKRKTVCGNTIHENITQISLKVVKYGKTPLVEVVAEAPAEGAEAKPVEKPVEKKAEAPKAEAKPVEKPAEPKVEKPVEKKTEPKAEAKAEKPKTEAKPAEKKE